MMIRGYLANLSVIRLMILAMMLVALLPLVILGYYINHSAWQDAWREVNEKHRSLALNLTSPIQIFVRDHQVMLSMIGESISAVDSRHAIMQDNHDILAQGLIQINGFQALLILDTRANTVLAMRRDGQVQQIHDGYGINPSYTNTLMDEQPSVSGALYSVIDQRPTILFTQPLFDERQVLQGVLIAEIDIEVIESLRKKIQFGTDGHSVILDQYGHVIAHPNPQWMAEIRNLSAVPIVQEMLAGHNGVTRFFSPWVGEDMVAGYAAVADIGWGIMVPQPEKEVAAQVHKLMRSYYVWTALGLLLAILLAWYLARRITRPLNQLVSAAQTLIDEKLVGELPDVTVSAPKEIHALNQVLQRLVANLQLSRDEITQLNDSLQRRVEEATQKLRDSNQRLEAVAHSDHLTALANRRHFEGSLSQMLSRRSGDVDHVCVLLIDIDHFKQINDAYGHAAGDAVLGHIARVLERAMRSDDLVARYGGDEFVAYMRCAHEVGFQRARQLRESIDKQPITYEGKNIHVTVSIGLYCQPLQQAVATHVVMERADTALYAAKRNGRNRVVDIAH